MDGEQSTRYLNTTHPTPYRFKIAFIHGLVDVALALIFFLGLAWILGFVFEVYNLWVDLKQVVLWSRDSHTGYAVQILNDPFGAGLWVTLMLFSTLFPTLIHLGFVIASMMPMAFLPDQRRLQLADNLEALAEIKPDDVLKAKAWVNTIFRAANYASGYRRRIFTSSIAAITLLVGISSLIIIMDKGFGLDQLAFNAAIHGIEMARSLFALS